MEYDYDSSHEKYIEIKASGVIRMIDLISALSKLMKHPDYPYKHCLWYFSDITLGIDVETLENMENATIASCIYEPKETVAANRIAIVVSGHFYKAIADLFITRVSTVPFKIEAFIDKDEAIGFLCSE